MARQLTFDLPVRESRSRGDFFVSDANALALARLDMPDTWPNRKLVLVGPVGAGKTHLANVWAEANGAFLIEPGALGGLDITNIAKPMVVDAADRVRRADEEVLFHLHNHLAASALPLLLTAETPPARWNIALPDLKSRMAAADVVRIEVPDDALLSAVMVKQFADRQLIVGPEVIAWLVAHMDRSFSMAQRVVDALDTVSLAESRAITRPLAQRVFESVKKDLH